MPAGYRVRVAAIMNRPGTGFAIEDFQPLHVKRAIENGRRNRFVNYEAVFGLLYMLEDPGVEDNSRMLFESSAPEK
jgi:hypothetical protein